MESAQTVDASSPALSVLVADDDDLVRLILRRALERAGFKVRDAATCPAAIEAAQSTVDLVMLDAHMPGGTLESTIAGVRDAAGPGIPILVLSGDARLPEHLAAPTVGYLAKPVQLDALLAEIDRLLTPSPDRG